MSHHRKTRHYPLLICGTSFAGIGAGVAIGKDAFLVERSSSVGHEFIGAIHPGVARDKLPNSTFARELQEEMLDRNLLGEDGTIHLPGVHPVLCKHIHDQALHVQFMTEILAVERLPQGGFEVEIFHSGGLETIHVNEILDTTSTRLSTPQNLYTSTDKKSLNAYLHHAENDAHTPEPFHEEMSIVHGRFPTEIIVKLTLDAEIEWPEARKMLHDLWASRPKEWSSYTLAAVADQFEMKVPAGPFELEKGWNWLPSIGFENPLEALDQGYMFLINKEELTHAAIQKG
ncbi:hypothetical protein [Paenibacillus roseipurpureus]|uniref:Uncharacterized protein n=1 Tax=Paenibacillus roseopurpureus TaxID=2918901 RepID=A0AA96LRU3_9BACL|nr:hypothetical protein [Paenibacillus sp. MBLB1832]WNR46066.1 hypothetical protein MJB10_08230 [Paenibacillus sp. MBLB1832]